MVLGMWNAPATFQRHMNIVLAGVSNCEVYLDNLVIFSDTRSEHMRVLETVFKL